MSLKNKIGAGILSGLEGIEDKKEMKRQRREEEKKSREEVNLPEKERYKQYNVKLHPNGEKYKANFSLDKEDLQRIKHIQFLEGLNNREYSTVISKSIRLYHEIYFTLLDQGIEIKDLLPEEILEILDKREEGDG